MAGCESEHVVSVDWLKQQLDQSNTRVRVLDATLHGQDNYKKSAQLSSVELQTVVLIPGGPVHTGRDARSEAN